MTVQELLEQIKHEYPSLSGAQKQVATYVFENYYQIPFLSISALASQIGVSDNTIVKFCVRFGFDKFAQFKNIFSEYVHSELVLFNKISGQETNSQREKNDFFMQGMDDDIAAINATLNNTSNRENLPALVKMINSAQNIYITGGRASGMMAGYFANILRYLGLNVHDVTFGVGDYLDRLSSIKKKDLVIVIAFSRYTAQVVDAVKELHMNHIPIALITDSGLSPCVPYSSISFYCGSASGYYFPSFAGCLSLIGVICRATVYSRKKDASEHIRQLEKRLINNGVFFQS